MALLPPLDTLPEWSGQYPTLGWQLADWATTRFLVPDGPTAGEPMALTERQLTFLLHWYALAPDGSFVYSGAAMRQARGTGKSPMMAFIGCCELVGPVRLAGFDATGEPIGRRVSMPLVQIAAVSLDQTENTANYCRAWLDKGTPLQKEFNLDPGRQIVYVPGFEGAAGGSLRLLTSSAATVRGARPTCVLADETGEWNASNGGVRFRARLGENAAKVRGARVIEGANSWTPGTGSVAEHRWDAWTAEQEAGASEHPFLMDVREAPADTDWESADSIREAIRVVYEPVPWMDVDQVMPTILDRFKPINESMREFGNLRVSELTSWVSAQDWDACADPADGLRDGDDVVLFVDPSESDDATAVVACRVSDGFVEPIWIHEPNALRADSRPFGPVDPAELDRQVMLAWDRFTVRALFADVHPMEQLVKSTWPDRYGDDLILWASPTDAVAFDMRKFKLEFAQAAELAASEIEATARALQDGGSADVASQIRHGGDSVLARHVYNTQRRPYQRHVSVGKGDQSRKIDGAVAMIGARHVRRLLLASKKWQRRRKTAGKGRVIVLS